MMAACAFRTWVIPDNADHDVEVFVRQTLLRDIPMFSLRRTEWSAACHRFSNMNRSNASEETGRSVLECLRSLTC